MDSRGILIELSSTGVPWGIPIHTDTCTPRPIQKLYPTHSSMYRGLTPNECLHSARLLKRHNSSGGQTSMTTDLLNCYKHLLNTITQWLFLVYLGSLISHSLMQRWLNNIQQIFIVNIYWVPSWQTSLSNTKKKKSYLYGVYILTVRDRQYRRNVINKWTNLMVL